MAIALVDGLQDATLLRQVGGDGERAILTGPTILTMALLTIAIPTMAGGGDEEWTGLAHGGAGAARAIVSIAIVSTAIVSIAVLGSRSTYYTCYGYAYPAYAHCATYGTGEQEQHAMVARALISVQQEVLEQHGLTQP